MATETPILTPTGLKSINDLRIGDEIISFDTELNKTTDKVIAIQDTEEEFFLEITTEDDLILRIAPNEQIFLLNNIWEKVDCVGIDQKLLTANGKPLTIKQIKKIFAKIETRRIRTQKHHNFFAGNNNILVHNWFLAIPILSWGGGTVAWFEGLTITGIVAGITSLFLSEKTPGIPGKNEGFVPPKNWNGQKVPNPNGRGYGYPDKQGRVWIPTGDNGHGGPHWDVQDPKTGKHTNIMPGGNERGKRK